MFCGYKFCIHSNTYLNRTVQHVLIQCITFVRTQSAMYKASLLIRCLVAKNEPITNKDYVFCVVEEVVKLKVSHLVNLTNPFVCRINSSHTRGTWKKRYERQILILFQWIYCKIQKHWKLWTGELPVKAKGKSKRFHEMFICISKFSKHLALQFSPKQDPSQSSKWDHSNSIWRNLWTMCGIHIDYHLYPHIATGPLVGCGGFETFLNRCSCIFAWNNFNLAHLPLFHLTFRLLVQVFFSPFSIIKYNTKFIQRAICPRKISPIVVNYHHFSSSFFKLP